MTCFRWLRNLFVARSRKDRRRLSALTRKPVRLVLERLESRLTPSAPTLSTLAFFNDTGPTGLIADSSGNLYGTIGSGGASNDGRIIELAKGSGTPTTLASFNGTNGSVPTSLIMDSSGDLYGTTEYGGASDDGTIFELAKSSSTITALASFNGTTGPLPVSALIMDGSGNLYGTTAGGGASNDGTVFELAKGSSTITTLASFNGTNGSEPTNLMMDGSGNLYGITSLGATSGTGTVFELAKGSSTITTLASFNGTNGALPNGGLIVDSSGNLYGTTETGGPADDGTIFELAKGSSTITTQASFNGTNGSSPNGGLIIDGSGNLYGTTEYGGIANNSNGTVFELAKGSSTITTLASFNGDYPNSGLIIDGSGNLYGTTAGGGASDVGTVFELAKGSSTITTLASFNENIGFLPAGGLILDSSGNLYGTTWGGGTSDDGTVFELAKGSSTITTLASFNGTNGSSPNGLITDSSGNLYGTTLGGGGASDGGTVFELAKGSSIITTLASFNETNGYTPRGGLIIDGSGNLYGTTELGGTAGEGTIFELQMSTSGNTAPVITGQPSSQTVESGAEVSFTASASGNPTPTVQWQVSTDGGSTFTAISGATSTTLTLSNVTTDMSGDEYEAVFTNSAGNATTSAATLTINAAPVAPAITSNPTSQTVTAGANVMFTATASGNPTPTVQWQVSTDGGSTFTAISGATSTTLTLSNVTTDMSGDEYEAVFTNSAGNATSNAATLTVTASTTAPTITIQPSNQTLTAGQTATFTAAASGNPTPTVQWQFSSDGGLIFSNISGATSTTLTLSNVQTSQSGYEYQAVFTNSAGSVTTSIATLTVSQSPPPPAPPSSPPPISSPPPAPSAPPALNVPPLLGLFDQFLGAAETVNADGSVTETARLFGFPLLVSTFNSSGNLESVTFFGINVTVLFELL